MSDQANLQLCNLVSAGVPLVEARQRLGLASGKGKPKVKVLPAPDEGGESAKTPETGSEGSLSETAEAAADAAAAAPDSEPKPPWMP